MKNHYWINYDVDLVFVEVKCKGETIVFMASLDKLPKLMAIGNRTWFGHEDKQGNLYIRYSIKSKTILLQRYLMDAVSSDLVVDHINRNTLDNRNENLRIVTRLQNGQNRGINKNNSTGYRGVVYHKSSGLYHAFTTANGIDYSGGYHANPEEAAKVAEQLRIQHHLMEVIPV